MPGFQLLQTEQNPPFRQVVFPTPMWHTRCSYVAKVSQQPEQEIEMNCCPQSVTGPREFKAVPVVNLSNATMRLPIIVVPSLSRIEERIVPFMLPEASATPASTVQIN
jgi:hypothetical protein